MGGTGRGGKTNPGRLEMMLKDFVYFTKQQGLCFHGRSNTRFHTRLEAMKAAIYTV